MVPEQYEQSCSLYYYFTTNNNKHTSTRIARMAHEMYRDASAIEVEPYQREMRSRGASRGAPAADGAGAVEDPALGVKKTSCAAGSCSCFSVRPRSGGGGPSAPDLRPRQWWWWRCSVRPRCAREGEGEDGSDSWDGRPGGLARICGTGGRYPVFPRRNGQSAGRVNSVPSVPFTAAGTGWEARWSRSKRFGSRVYPLTAGPLVLASHLVHPGFYILVLVAYLPRVTVQLHPYKSGRKIH